MALTGPEGDEWWPVHRWLRQADDGLHTIVDTTRVLRWIRWDEQREGWVRSGGQEDGAPVPLPCSVVVGP